jgi:hypothetical protein
MDIDRGSKPFAGASISSPKETPACKQQKVINHDYLLSDMPFPERTY